MAEIETRGDGIHASWGGHGVGGASFCNGAMVCVLITSSVTIFLACSVHANIYKHPYVCRKSFQGFTWGAQNVLWAS